MTHVCEYCGHEPEFASVIVACRETCEQDDKNTREWFSKYDPHRKD